MRIGSLVIPLIAGALLASELAWPGAGYRLWMGVALAIAWVIARSSHVFSTR